MDYKIIFSILKENDKIELVILTNLIFQEIYIDVV